MTHVISARIVTSESTDVNMMNEYWIVVSSINAITNRTTTIGDQNGNPNGIYISCIVTTEMHFLNTRIDKLIY